MNSFYQYNKLLKEIFMLNLDAVRMNIENVLYKSWDLHLHVRFVQLQVLQESKIYFDTIFLKCLICLKMLFFCNCVV